MSEPDPRYWAFISYSSHDEALARKLHRALEHYRIPRGLVGRPAGDGAPLPRRLFPIFRDRDELPLSADLGDAIEGALRSSRHLIVLCSPRAATSRWVNEEVRYFKSIGREGRILAIIVSGRPNAEDHGLPATEECFPPALRYVVDGQGELTDERSEPVGGDLHRDGWKVCVLKAVAGITGIGLTALTQRDKARHRTRRLVYAATGLVVLAGLFAWWDQTRTKVAYYAHLTERFGVPQGVGPVPAEEQPRRSSTYRVESSRGKVRRAVHLGKDGRPTPIGENLREPFGDFTASYGVSYREDGSVQSVELSREDGFRGDRFAIRKIFSSLNPGPDGSTCIVDIKSKSEDRQIPVPPEKTGSRSEMTEVHAQRITYRSDGLPQSAAFLNAYRLPAPDQTGLGGKRFIYDNKGLLVGVVFLDTSGQPSQRQDGVQSVVYTRNQEGYIIETAYLGPGGEPATLQSGVHKVLNARDSRGNKLSEENLDSRGKPLAVGRHSKAAYHRAEEEFIPDDAWASAKWSYDEQGNESRVTYFGADGRPVVAKGGYAERTLKRNTAGLVTEESYSGADGRPRPVSDGYDVVKRYYDKEGSLVREEYFLGGKPVLNRDGFAGQRIAKNGDEKLFRYFGTDGRPIVTKNGYAERRVRSDANGNLTDESYFGVDGKAVLTTDGYARRSLKYTAVGGVAEESYFGLDGNPAVNKNKGYASKKHDGDGKKFFGADGEPVVTGNYVKYAAERITHDERGRLKEISFFGIDGRPIRTQEQKYDERGNVTEIVGRGTDGKVVGGRRIRYDEQGNIVEDFEFDASGQPASFVERYKFDASGNRTGKAFFDAQGRPVASGGGYASVKTTYDHARRKIEVAYFDTRGRPVSSKDGYAVMKRSYSDDGTFTETRYDTNGQPLRSP